MAQAPFVVEPDIGTVHAQVEQVIQILASGNPGVEAQALEGLLVQGKAPAAHMVRTGEPGAGKGLVDPLVERASLIPIAVVPLILAEGMAVPFGIQVVSALREDGNAPARQLAQAVHALLQKGSVIDNLVVIDEHDAVETQDICKDEPQVADGGITGQPDLEFQPPEPELLEAAPDDVEFPRSHHHDAEQGETRGDFPHLFRRLLLDPPLCRDQHGNGTDATDPIERFQATGKLPFAHQRGRMVVHDRIVSVRGHRMARGDIGWDDNQGVHAGSFPFFARQSTGTVLHFRNARLRTGAF